VSPTSPELWINADEKNGGSPTMKNVVLQAAFNPDPKGLSKKATYDWNAKVTYVFKRRPNCGGSKSLPPDDFPKMLPLGHRIGNGWSPRTLFQDGKGHDVICGGNMEVEVKSQGQIGTRTSKDHNSIHVMGENPTICNLAQFIGQIEPNERIQKWLKKIAGFESSGMQFNTITKNRDKHGNLRSEKNIYNYKGDPVLNDGGDGGMGIFQITIAKLDPEERKKLLWNWEYNVIKGDIMFNDMFKWVKKYNFPSRVRKWANNEGLKNINSYRKAVGLTPFVKIVVNDYPDYEEFNIENAVRCFNAIGSKDRDTNLLPFEYFPPISHFDQDFKCYRSEIITNFGLNKNGDWDSWSSRGEHRIWSYLKVTPSKTDPSVGIMNDWVHYPWQLREHVGDKNYYNDVNNNKKIKCD
jgi:hypothetical protein